MTQLLAVDTIAANSADIVVADGAAATVFLKGASGDFITYGAKVDIQIKTAAGQYVRVGRLEATSVATVIAAPGTYRVSRIATGVAVGVELG